MEAPRCGAKTRKGTPCKGPAVCGKKRCRMHGGTNPGAPRGNKNRLAHGFFTVEAMENRKRARQIARDARKIMEELNV